MNAERARLRREVAGDLHRLLDRLADGDVNGHLVVLSDYHVVNLRSALHATGYASVYRSPLGVLQTGDWLGELFHLLPDVTSIAPNAEPGVLAQRAVEWRDVRALGDDEPVAPLEGELAWARNRIVELERELAQATAGR